MNLSQTDYANQIPQRTESTPYFPELPKGAQRDSFVAMVERVAGKMGVSRSALRTFTKLAGMTRPRDWTSSDTEPRVYAHASEIAKVVGLSISRYRAHEKELDAAGLIEKRTAANGGRSKYAGTGIYFSSIINSYDRVKNLDEHATAERHAAIYLRGQRSMNRRCITEAIEQINLVAPNDPELAMITAEFSTWPRAEKLHGMTNSELEEHAAAADALTRSAVKLHSKLTKTGSKPLENRRSYIQDTIEDISVSCNDQIQTSPERPYNENSEEAENEGNANPLTESMLDNEFVEKLGSERLFSLASEEMQFYLSARADPSELMFQDFIWTAQTRLQELGIDFPVWEEACSKMGVVRATISVLILDARSSQPNTTIIKAGAYLRGMTRAYLRNELNLIGSLIGLNEKQVH